MGPDFRGVIVLVCAQLRSGELSYMVYAQIVYAAAVNSRCLFGLFFGVAWFVNCNICVCAVLVDSGVGVIL